MATYSSCLLTFFLSLANGLIKADQSLLSRTIEVVGIIWFFIICAVFFARIMPQGNIKPDWLKPVFWLLVIAISLYLIITGTIGSYKALNFTNLLTDLFRAIIGVLLVVAALTKDKLAQYAPF
jgi:hypothetical protein